MPAWLFLSGDQFTTHPLFGDTRKFTHFIARAKTFRGDAAAHLPAAFCDVAPEGR
ncbi:hypothetical protein ACKU5B_027730 [Klebsiella pneumoniae]